jgi:hypothetical protein
VGSLCDKNSGSSVEPDPRRLDAFLTVVKIPIELSYDSESFQTFRHFRPRKRSFSMHGVYLETNEFVDLTLNGLDHGWHLPRHFSQWPSAVQAQDSA